MYLLFSLIRFAVITVQSSENLNVHSLLNNLPNRFDSCILWKTRIFFQTFCNSRTHPNFVFNENFIANKLDITIN